MPNRPHPVARYLPAVALLAPLLALGGCGAPHSRSADAIATFTLTTRAGITDYAVDPDPLKRAAAGYFRDVAVNAPAEAADRLGARVRDALYSEKGVHPSLGSKVRGAIVPQLAALDAAARRGDRQALALASLEAYRLLTEDISTATKVPTAMTLIDYAQLVGTVQAQAAEPDWAAVSAAFSLADRKWHEIADNLSDTDAAAAMAASLDAMTAAAQRHDVAATRRALEAARPPYDRLVTYFRRA